MGLLGPYGFYEAADLTPSRVKPGAAFEAVRCWLAHHQGMSLIAVANTLCNSSSQRRFHAGTMVGAPERLVRQNAPPLAGLATPQKQPDTTAGASNAQA